MEKLAMCRICLVEDVRMYVVVNKNLHELYEKLTDVPFVTEDRRPMLACFFCCTKLKQCWRFLRKCLEAEELFAQMLSEDYERDPLVYTGHLKFLKGFSNSPIEIISIVGDGQTESDAIKEELPDVGEGLDDIIDPKEKPQTDKLKLETVEESYPDVKDSPVHYAESDSEYEVPLMEIKIEVEDEQESIGAPVSKKPRLDTRRSTLEDTISAEHKKHEINRKANRAMKKTDSDIESEQEEEESQEQEESSTTWSETAFTPVLREFNDSTAGIQSNGVNSQSKVLDCFLHFLGEEIVCKIVEFTNAQHQFIRRCDIRDFSRLQNWREVSVAEMYIFLAVTFLFTRNKHLTIDEHWATDLLLQSPIFSKTMTRNRYTSILGLLSFASPETDSAHVLKDILPLLQHIKNSFRSSLTPYRDLCINEKIMPFKGYVSIEQYIPNKTNRFGIKLFIISDVKTKLIIDFIIYCGSRTEIEDPNNLGVDGAVVTTLLEGLTDANRRIYVDNWCSSPKLYNYLYDRKTYACGPVLLNRLEKAGVGAFKPLKKGEIHAKYNKPLMALKYKDNRDIYMLSTCHTAELVPSSKKYRQSGLSVMKPEIIIDYNKKKETVDNTDVLLRSVQCIKKSKIWHKKLGLHLIDLCMLNAHVFFKIIHKNTVSLADFQLEVIRQLIEKYKVHESEYSVPTSSRSTSLLRLSAQHLADHMPEYIEGKKSRSCFVCQHTKLNVKCRKESRFMCKVCQVTLCTVPCFKIYHKQRDF